MALFDERGFDTVTVDEITKKAGVAKGTFYTYFATKSDIVVEEFWNIDAYYASYASRNLHNYATAQEKLMAFTRAQMRYVRDVIGNKNLKILYANQAVQAGPEKMITTKDRQWHRIIRDIISAGQASGEFRTDLDADRLTVLFNRAARGTFLDWCVEDAGFDLVKEGLSAMRDFTLRALMPAEAGSSCPQK